MLSFLSFVLCLESTVNQEDVSVCVCVECGVCLCVGCVCVFIHVVLCYLSC